MAKDQENLSHEEVWDDSALIDSWNQALAEYKKYHSIHAKGGSVKDLESKAQASKDQPPEEQPGESIVEDEEPPAEKATSGDHAPSATHQPPVGNESANAFPVQAVLGSMKDENLKKLLMSWYYAGYYTGLYEGQQQANQGQ